jgi:thioredoxin-related protein
MLLPLRAATRVAGVVALSATLCAFVQPSSASRPTAISQEGSGAAKAEAAWLADFDEAAKLAKAQNKDLLVDFTGSDWCGWCIKLDKEVFAHAAFLDEATKQYVLVKLDFPHGEAAKQKVPNPQRNDELQEKYAIGGFPTILLMTADGEVYASTGYQPGGPEKYVKHLGEVRTQGKNALAALDAYGKADEATKPAAWDALATAFEGLGSSSLADKLAPGIREALAFDASNAQGRKLRALKALHKSHRADEADTAAARELDPKNEHGLLELVVLASYSSIHDQESARKALETFDALGPVKDKETALMLNTHSANVAKQLGDMARAKAYAQKAKEIGSDDEGLLKFLDQILGS